MLMRFIERRMFSLSETTQKILCNHDHDHPDLDQLHGMMPDDDRLYDLADLLGMTQSAVSHQLRTLKAAKLVRFRREGKSIIYALDDDHVRQILCVGLEHLMHTH